MKVQEALKAAIEALEKAENLINEISIVMVNLGVSAEKIGLGRESQLMPVARQCKSALSNIEKSYEKTTPVSEPVYLIVSGADEIVVTKEKYDSWSSAKRISYTSPQPRDWVLPSNEVIDTLWHKATYESVAHSEPFTRYRFSELLIKQLNTKG